MRYWHDEVLRTKPKAPGRRGPCPMHPTGKHVFTSRKVVTKPGHWKVQSDGFNLGGPEWIEPVVISDEVICSWCTTPKR